MTLFKQERGLHNIFKLLMRSSLMTRVVNLKHEDCDIRICRPGQWGNPFHIGRDGARAQVIEKYREWIMTQPKLLAQLHILKGKRLGCLCAPLACHGDVLVELCERAENVERTGINGAN